MSLRAEGGNPVAERVLCKYKSRRNNTYLIQSETDCYVSKRFLTMEGFRRELEVYKLLRDRGLPSAQVAAVLDMQLLLTKLPGSDLVDCLERQERSQYPKWLLWEKLVDWQLRFHEITGFVMTDVNLRNFLYDDQAKVLYGVDFEECTRGSLFESAAKTAAFIRTYDPENTPMKQNISKFVLQRFAQSCGFEMDLLFRESKRQELLLLERRKNKIS